MDDLSSKKIEQNPYYIAGYSQAKKEILEWLPNERLGSFNECLDLIKNKLK